MKISQHRRALNSAVLDTRDSVAQRRAEGTDDRLVELLIHAAHRDSKYSQTEEP